MKIMAIKLITFFILGTGSLQCQTINNNKAGSLNSTEKIYLVKNKNIIVDGNADDWADIPARDVNAPYKFWYGEGLPKGNPKGEKDLSFSWKVAHHSGKLFFLINVKDDSLSNFNQEFAWLNDCVEIHLDHQHLKGNRIEGINSKSSLEDRFGKRLFGHEMQFLPSDTPQVFFDDSKQIYYTNAPQTIAFKKEWKGEAVTKHFKDGYIMEIGFAIPNFFVSTSQKMGVDFAVCDDDGRGRESLLVASGNKGEFWLTMDNFIELVIE